MAGNAPQNAPDRAGATKQGAVASSGLSGRTDRTARNGEAPVIVPSETKPARSAPMSDAEFDAMYRAIRAELVRAEKPLIDESKPVEVHVQKIRYHEIGGLTGNSPVLLRHDKTTGRYKERAA